MKTIIVPLIGDPIENLYQLGLREKDSYLELETRIKKLLSTNHLLSLGQDFITRAKVMLRKREDTFFDKCINSYSQGLGIDPTRYLAFLNLFELAAHYGQVYPELKGMLPGCTSVFSNIDGDITHTRLMDFPLIGIFDQRPRLYYWRPEGKMPLLTYSCEGMAPLFFQGLHGAGVSFAVHHKPGKSYFQEGQSIFQIMFESVFDSQHYSELKKEIKKKSTITKWSVLLLEKKGHVQVIDIDGPAHNSESYDVNETSPLIFTNIPLQNDTGNTNAYLRFSELRQRWLKEKLEKKTSLHMLDILTSIEDQKTKNWLHPTATLSTIGAWHVDLTKGLVDVKEGEKALTASDALLRVNLAGDPQLKVLKEEAKLRPFEEAWKRASSAQSAFDEGNYDLAYHEIQMAGALMPHPIWKEILSFYECVWDFKFISNSRELSMIYKKLKSLKVPEFLKDQWVLLVMRMEKKLDLAPTVTFHDVSPALQDLFQQEKLASKPLFATWMKLLYPRMEILDVFSPHHK
jgi:hypothetical protein